MMDVKIVKMTDFHIGAIAGLEEACFTTPWSESGLKSELSNRFSRFFVAVCDNSVVGYIGSHNICGEVYITNVAVSPELRRKGVGKKLICFLVEQMQSENADFITLEVRKSNSSAISLYDKCGFVKVGERQNFYEKPREDAVLMTYFMN